MNSLRLTPEQAAAYQERAAAWKKPELELPTLVPGKKLIISSEAAAKPGKYRNQPVEVDGLRFDSKREARRWVELKAMQQAGQITNLRTQVEIPCVVNGVTVCSYVADFAYFRGNQLRGPEVVEDVKSAGTRTAVYKIKRKLVAACTGVEIIEV